MFVVLCIIIVGVQHRLLADHAGSRQDPRYRHSEDDGRQRRSLLKIFMTLSASASA
jgi:hypothetical protein